MSDIAIKSGDLTLQGFLEVPPDATGIVIFAHGSGSGRFSPRNQFVAEVLQDFGIGTVLLDLLTESESDNRDKVFDIDLLTDRLLLATDWVDRQKNLARLPIGYFGASTGAAAALQGAARHADRISAVVSRGGRPDLARAWLHKVDAATLLIVGGDDSRVIELNRQAYHALICEKRLEIISGATHLFEEPGALEDVARLASRWFKQYLTMRTPELHPQV